MDTIDVIYLVFSILFGLVIGSFLNVCIYRLPRGNFFEKSRSYCPKCGAELKWYHNVPLFSYIFLGGKCAFCKERISWRYPFVEAVNAGLWACNFLEFGLTFETLIYDVAFSAILVMFFIDLDTQEIPNGIVLLIAALGVAAFFAMPEVVWWHRLVGAVIVSVPLLILALVTNGFGGGDIKLFFALGLLLGMRQTLVCALISIVIGGVVGAILMITKKAKKGTQIPFGPFIGIAVIATVYFGEQLLAWYLP